MNYVTKYQKVLNASRDVLLSLETIPGIDLKETMLWFAFTISSSLEDINTREPVDENDTPEKRPAFIYKYALQRLNSIFPKSSGTMRPILKKLIEAGCLDIYQYAGINYNQHGEVESRTAAKYEIYRPAETMTNTPIKQVVDLVPLNPSSEWDKISSTTLRMYRDGYCGIGHVEAPEPLTFEESYILFLSLLQSDFGRVGCHRGWFAEIDIKALCYYLKLPRTKLMLSLDKLEKYGLMKLFGRRTDNVRMVRVSRWFTTDKGKIKKISERMVDANPEKNLIFE